MHVEDATSIEATPVVDTRHDGSTSNQGGISVNEETLENPEPQYQRSQRSRKPPDRYGDCISYQEVFDEVFN